MEKKYAEIVITNAVNVKVVHQPVPNVLMILTDQTSPIVNVKTDGMIVELLLVDNVYQNVTNVTPLTTVLNVMKQELQDQKEIAHALMDNSNTNITVTIVKSNVKNVKPLQEFVQYVLETEMVNPIVIAHTELMTSALLNAHHVNSHVTHVLEPQRIVKFVLKVMKTHQNVH